MAYPCFCTEEELSAAHEQQEKNKENFGYYGKYAVWRDRPMEDIEAELAKGTPYVVRFRSEGSIEHKIRHEDLVKGKMEVTENDQDVVILKSDGIPTYHFAHVVDDHLMARPSLSAARSGWQRCRYTCSCSARWAGRRRSTHTPPS